MKNRNRDSIGRRIRVMGLAAAAVCICCIQSTVPAAATQSQIEDIQEDIRDLEKEQAQNRQELEELEAGKAYLDEKLSGLNEQLSALAQELTALQEQMTSMEEEILRNKQQLADARSKEEEQYENMKLRIRFLYERGNSSILEALMGAGSFADLLNLSEYVESVHTYDREMLQQYRLVKEEIAAREVRLEEEQRELEMMTGQLLAALIECEAGSEYYEGMLAVGSVVMNRVRSSYFPDTVVEVIYQSGQFSPVASGRFAAVLNRGAGEACMQAAREVLAGNITNDCLYFRKNTGTIQGTVIGNHVFY